MSLLRNAKSKKTTEKKTATKKVVNVKEAKVNKTVYAILTILLGSFGINKFYAKKFKKGIACLLFCWTLVPTVLSIAEFITVLTEKADKDGKIAVSSSRRETVLFATSLILFTLLIFVLLSVIPIIILKCHTPVSFMRED